MTNSETNIIPAMPNTYKLTDDAIKAVRILVDQDVKSILRNLELEDIVFKRYQEQLDKYMMKQYPDLSNRLNSLSLILDEKAKLLEKKLKDIELREKKLVKSETLYEDVYDMRDQFKEIQKFFVDFQKKMKKVFEL